jgi:hypothetical protein
MVWPENLCAYCDLKHGREEYLMAYHIAVKPILVYELFTFVYSLIWLLGIQIVPLFDLLPVQVSPTYFQKRRIICHYQSPLHSDPSLVAASCAGEKDWWIRSFPDGICAMTSIFLCPLEPLSPSRQSRPFQQRITSRRNSEDQCINSYAVINIPSVPNHFFPDK